MYGKMKWNTGLIFGLVFLLALTPWAWAGGKAAKNGDTVDIQYVGKFEDGSVFDKSEKGQPLSFELGTPRIIPGMNKAVEGMKVGESKTVTIPPAEAYGDYDEKLVQKVPRTVLPPDLFEKYAGLSFWRDPKGSQAFRITVQPEQSAAP